jgi:hypothetical protein
LHLYRFANGSSAVQVVLGISGFHALKDHILIASDDTVLDRVIARFKHHIVDLSFVRERDGGGFADADRLSTFRPSSSSDEQCSRH